MSGVTETEVWGDRGDSLITAMRVMSRPVKMASLVAFARRKGWEMPTLDGVLEYLHRHQRIERYKCYDGESAFRMISDGERGAASESDDDDETAASPREERMTTAEVAQLIGISTVAVNAAARRGKLKGTQEGRNWTFERTAVAAYLEARKPTQSLHSSKTLDAGPQRTIADRLGRANPSDQRISDTVLFTDDDPLNANDLADDVRTLVRCVDRGWLSESDAFARLREIAEKA
jgi:excisionase family DNA binding protein